ncbi:hypothetical protein ACGFJC_24875 [Nonomuraea fuscirosea]|uniref:hypothetical protein n=1 Tax=Nonomuraea fuscirosea TaxID=1291556 RepID=UPI00346A865A
MRHDLFEKRVNVRGGWFGVALRDTGRFPEAAREPAEARHAFRALARRTAEGNVRYHLAETHRQADQGAQR